MLQVPVYNQNGEQVGEVELDEALFGGTVRKSLLKQAIVMHLANRRQGTVATRNRSHTAGSTRKIFKQKGTGNARMGANRNPVRTGGGVAHGKVPRDYTQKMPAKARRRALDTALLAKFLAGEVLVLESFGLEQIKTRPVVELLAKLKVDRTCLIVLAEPDETVWKSARNIPGVCVNTAANLFAYGVVVKQKIVMTRAALDALVAAREGKVTAGESLVETT